MKVSKARENILKVVGQVDVDEMGNTQYTGKAVEVVPSEVGLTFDQLDMILGMMEEDGEVGVKYENFSGLSLFLVTLTEYGLKVHQTHFEVKMKIN